MKNQTNFLKRKLTTLFFLTITLIIKTNISFGATYNITTGGGTNFGSYINYMGSGLPAPACGDIFNIHCDVTIDQNYYFDGCTFNVDGGFGMSLDPGVKVTFDRCVANTSSTTDTWTGIYAGNYDNVIYIKDISTCTATAGSYFSNMDAGVVCDNGALLFADNTYFNSNSNSIQILNAPTGTYSGVIENNHFTGTASMLTNSLGLTWSNCGININNVANSSLSDVINIGGTGTGQANYFTALLFGVYNTNANLDIEGNVFRTIGFSAAAATQIQSGIYILNQPGSVVNCVKNDFLYCYSMGIFCNAYKSTIHISANFFDGVENENIFMNKCDGSDISIEDNNNCNNWGGGTNLGWGTTQYAIRATNNQLAGLGVPTNLKIENNDLNNSGIRRVSM